MCDVRRSFHSGDVGDPRQVPQLTQQDLVALPEVVASFNGLYSRHGIFVMMSHTRVLAAFGIGAIVVLMGVGWALRRYLRFRKRRRAAA